MSTIKPDTPAAPLEWNKTEARDEVPTPRPEESFVDDELVARLKGRETQQQRAPLEQAMALPSRIVSEFNTKVDRAAAFRPAEQDDPETRRAKRRGEGDVAAPRGGTTAPRKKKRQAADAAEVEASASRGPQRRDSLEAGREMARLQQFVDRLCELESKIAAAALRLPPTDLAARAAALTTAQRRLEAEIRFALQALLTSGLGFVLLSDPRRTLGRLFRRWRRWPRSVAPGRRPDSDAEIDAFLAWIFEPPALPAELL